MKSLTLSLMTGSHRYLVKLRGTFLVAQTMTLTRVTVYQRTLHVPGPGTCTSPMMSSMTTSYWTVKSAMMPELEKADWSGLAVLGRR